MTDPAKIRVKSVFYPIISEKFSDIIACMKSLYHTTISHDCILVYYNVFKYVDKYFFELTDNPKTCKKSMISFWKGNKKIGTV